MNLVFGPLTLSTGCVPMVLTTTPPQPASNARRILESDSVGGADASRNGFSKSIPVKRVVSVVFIGPRSLPRRSFSEGGGQSYADWRLDGRDERHHLAQVGGPLFEQLSPPPCAR